MWTSRVGSDARIDSLKDVVLRAVYPGSDEGCPKHNLFTLEYSTSRCARL